MSRPRRRLISVSTALRASSMGLGCFWAWGGAVEVPSSPSADVSAKTAIKPATNATALTKRRGSRLPSADLRLGRTWLGRGIPATADSNSVGANCRRRCRRAITSSSSDFSWRDDTVCAGTTVLPLDSNLRPAKDSHRRCFGLLGGPIAYSTISTIEQWHFDLNQRTAAQRQLR
jgi:hypothetical protein